MLSMHFISSAGYTMMCVFTAGTIAAVIALLFLIVFIRSDCDLLLMFKTKFGKQPGKFVA